MCVKHFIGKHMISATKSIRYYPPHLGMLLHYLGKLKSNFSRYSADMGENANKLHFKFTAFNSSMQQCKDFENRLRFDNVTESSKVGTFLETQCTFHLIYHHTVVCHMIVCMKIFQWADLLKVQTAALSLAVLFLLPCRTESFHIRRIIFKMAACHVRVRCTCCHLARSRDVSSMMPFVTAVDLVTPPARIL